VSLAAVLLLSTARATSASSDYLTDRDMERVRAHLPAYRLAAGRAGVPVLALPAIHYRECGLLPTLYSVRTGQAVWNWGGPFMLDRGGRNVDEFRRRIRSYEREVAARYLVRPVPRVRDDLAFAALCAAHELRGKARGRFFDRRGRVDLDVLADAFWGYNGRSARARSWRDAAYVSNDPKRRRRFKVRVRTSTGIMTYLDRRPGALVIYYELQRRMGENP